MGHNQTTSGSESDTPEGDPPARHHPATTTLGPGARKRDRSATSTPAPATRPGTPTRAGPTCVPAEAVVTGPGRTEGRHPSPAPTPPRTPLACRRTCRPTSRDGPRGGRHPRRGRDSPGLDGRDVILGVAGDRGVLGFLVLGGGYPPRVASVVALVVLAVTAEALGRGRSRDALTGLVRRVREGHHAGTAERHHRRHCGNAEIPVRERRPGSASCDLSSPHSLSIPDET